MARRQTGGRIRAAIFLLFSMVAAIVASFVIYSVIQNYQKELDNAQIPDKTIYVLAATHDLVPGTNIRRQDLTSVEIPPAYVTAEVYRDMNQVIGRVPKERILKNEFIRQSRLAAPDGGFGLNAIVPKGMRAVSISVSAGSAVSGFINPGNYVDVIVTVGGQTVTLLEAVTILAVDDRMGPRSSKSSSKGKGETITLAVTPDNAERVQHATKSGSITLTLRNDIDVTQVHAHGEEVEELIGRNAESRIQVTQWKKQPSKQRQSGSLIIIRGRNESRQTVRSNK